MLIMSKYSIFGLTAVCILVVCNEMLASDPPTVEEFYKPFSNPQFPEESSWLREQAEKIKTIKVGSTREELLKVFVPEGGTSQRTAGSFLYRNCTLIKVDVEFEEVAKGENPDHPFYRFTQDKVINISKPYIETSIVID